MKNHHQGWRRLISAANYSKQGFISSWHSEGCDQTRTDGIAGVAAICFLG